MAGAFALHVQTRDGVQALARVVGVMALYDLTPSTLAARGDASGLTIESQFSEGAHAGELCLARLRALFVVADAQILFSPDPGAGLRTES
jgi:hypothetical protein